MFKDLYHKLLGKLHINGRDFTVFLLSLLLAFSIWLIHNLSEVYSDTVGVSVVAESNLEGHAQTSSNSNAIVARCRTTGFNLIKLHASSKRKAVTVNFDKEDFHHKEGEYYYITAEALSNYVSELYGSGVSLESFTSPSVTFRFPYENHKKVPVQVVSLVTFKSQFMATSQMKLDPDSVMIYGEPLHLEQVDKVYTKSIELSNIHSSAHGLVSIEKINGIRMSITEVNYSLDVARFVEIPSTIVVKTRNVPSDRVLSVYPSKANVILRCIFPVTNDPTGKVNLYIDYQDFKNSINGRCVPKTSKLPQGVIDEVIDPQIFECVETFKK